MNDGGRGRMHVPMLIYYETIKLWLEHFSKNYALGGIWCRIRSAIRQIYHSITNEIEKKKLIRSEEYGHDDK